MRLPLFWLTDYVDPGLEPFKLAERLDMTGTAVERIHTHGYWKDGESNHPDHDLGKEI